MYTLRCTERLMHRLASLSTTTDAVPTTRLGDWYANVLVVRPRHLVLAISERSLLPVVVLAKDAGSLPARLADAVHATLSSLGIAGPAADLERAEMQSASVGRTASRRILGTLNDLMVGLQCGLQAAPHRSLLEHSLHLAETPCKVLGHDSPDRATRALFAAGRDEAGVARQANGGASVPTLARRGAAMPGGIDPQPAGIAAHVRDATLDDAGILLDAERAVAAQYPGMLVSLPDELELVAFRERIVRAEKGIGRYVVAEVDGRIVGHASLYPMERRQLEHVLRLDMCVHPGHWHQGHGRTLLGCLVEWARGASRYRKIELLVRETHAPAIRLYRSFGFVEEGRHRDRVRLRDGTFIDDIAMALSLGSR